MTKMNISERIVDLIAFICITVVLGFFFILTFAIKFGVIYFIFGCVLKVDMTPFAIGMIGTVCLISNVEWWKKNLRG